MNRQVDREWANRLYLMLSGVFIASLVSSNLIFQKFFIWKPFEFLSDFFPFLSEYAFELSVGILPYPITFLVTDIISEIYGRNKANQVVLSGFIASMFIMAVVTIGDMAPATDWSPIDDGTFHRVFGLFGPAVFASMSAYLLAQFIDIRMFHYWKQLTKGKHLWLRNNGSTIFSQLIDTCSVIMLLCFFGVLEWSRFWSLFMNGFLFKVMIAAIDTPLFYLFSHLLRKSFDLKLGEELKSS